MIDRGGRYGMVDRVAFYGLGIFNLHEGLL